MVRVAATAFVIALLQPASTSRADAIPLKKCPNDAVVSGTVCMDRYEASVWRVPDPGVANKALVKKIQQGKATVADLTKGGATQLGIAGDDYDPCSDSGQNCADDIYAVSIAGVKPARALTWFQAVAACENARKRLPSNGEWQAAVQGTPDPGPDDDATTCNTTNDGAANEPVLTGSRAACVSSRGAFDMVGNLFEWVEDWVPRSVGFGAWNAGVSPTGDTQGLDGAATTGEPGAFLRGGNFGSGTSAGPLSILAGIEPSRSGDSGIGFRCAR
jgi:formylglycine-generating enzyme required for sulfatase activity